MKSNAEKALPKGETHLEPAPLSAAKADLWAKTSGWNALEAAALLLGIDPGTVSSSRRDRSDKDDRLVLCLEYERILRRAIDMGKLPALTPPKLMLSWAKSNNVDANEAIVEAVMKGKQIRDYRRLYRKLEKKMNASIEELSAPKSKRRKSLLIVIGCIARQKYNHSKTNNATKMLLSGIHLVGQSLDYGNLGDIMTDCLPFT